MWEMLPQHQALDTSVVLSAGKLGLVRGIGSAASHFVLRTRVQLAFTYGGSGGDRTHGQWLKRPLLYH